MRGTNAANSPCLSFDRVLSPHRIYSSSPPYVLPKPYILSLNKLCKNQKNLFHSFIVSVFERGCSSLQSLQINLLDHLADPPRTQCIFPYLHPSFPSSTSLRLYPRPSPKVYQLEPAKQSFLPQTTTKSTKTPNSSTKPPASVPSRPTVASASQSPSSPTTSTSAI